MTGTYFAGGLRWRYDLNVLVAEGEHQDNVHNALYAELARGVVLPATRARFRAGITDLVARGAEVIVLACTEFGMVVQAGDSPYQSLTRPSPTPRPPSRWHWPTNLFSPEPEPVHHPAAVALLPGRCFGRKIWSMTSAPVVITGPSACRTGHLTCKNSVELRGFEPLTPSMRTRCATGLRYSPENLS